MRAIDMLHEPRDVCAPLAGPLGCHSARRGPVSLLMGGNYTTASGCSLWGPLHTLNEAARAPSGSVRVMARTGTVEITSAS